MTQVVKFQAGDYPVLAEYQQLLNERDDLLAKLKAKATEALKEACIKIFHDFPEVDSFAWAQYSGEYNDDGPYHGINTVVLNDEWNDAHYAILDGWRSNSPIATEITERIEALGPDILMEVLGGYHQVTVTKSGIDVDTLSY